VSSVPGWRLRWVGETRQIQDSENKRRCEAATETHKDEECRNEWLVMCASRSKIQIPFPDSHLCLAVTFSHMLAEASRLQPMKGERMDNAAGTCSSSRL
jgi:hypothetical protein